MHLFSFLGAKLVQGERRGKEKLEKFLFDASEPLRFFTTKGHEYARSHAADWLYHEGALSDTKALRRSVFVREGPLRAAKPSGGLALPRRGTKEHEAIRRRFFPRRAAKGREALRINSNAKGPLGHEETRSLAAKYFTTKRHEWTRRPCGGVFTTKCHAEARCPAAEYDCNDCQYDAAGDHWLPTRNVTGAQKKPHSNCFK